MFCEKLRHQAAARASLCVGPRGVLESVHHPPSLRTDARKVATGFIVFLARSNWQIDDPSRPVCGRVPEWPGK